MSFQRLFWMFGRYQSVFLSIMLSVCVQCECVHVCGRWGMDGCVCVRVGGWVGVWGAVLRKGGQEVGTVMCVCVSQLI